MGHSVYSTCSRSTDPGIVFTKKANGLKTSFLHKCPWCLWVNYHTDTKMTIKIRICTKCGCLPPQLCLAVIFNKWPGPEDDSTHILTSNPIRWCKKYSQMNDYKYYKPTSGLHISLGNLPEKQITSRIACQWLSWPQESRTNGCPLTCCSKVLSSIMHTQKVQVEGICEFRVNRK